MKSYVAFSLLLIIVCVLGCAKPMPHREVVEAMQRCEVAGLDVRQTRIGRDGDQVSSVHCVEPHGRHQ